MGWEERVLEYERLNPRPDTEFWRRTEAWYLGKGESWNPSDAPPPVHAPVIIHGPSMSVQAETCVTDDDVRACISYELDDHDRPVKVAEEDVEGILQGCVGDIVEAVQEAVDRVVLDACETVIERMKKQGYTLEEED